MDNFEKAKLNPGKTFWKKGACSHTMFHLLNYEFDNVKPKEEKAADILAGGIAMKGHQCGMLWGAALAVGAESFRRYNDRKEAIEAEAASSKEVIATESLLYISEATSTAINASKYLIESFHHRAGTVNCRDITKVDWEKKSHFIFFLMKTVAQGFIFSPCFRFIDKWTPEAIQAANKGLLEITEQNKPCLSCASEVLRKMGASDEASITVAGFAGGIGLSGNGCGALSAVIWYKMLEWGENNPGKTPSMFKNPVIKGILQTFYNQTGSEMLCHKICGRKFASVNEHTEYLKNGGCRNLIEALSNT